MFSPRRPLEKRPSIQDMPGEKISTGHAREKDHYRTCQGKRLQDMPGEKIITGHAKGKYHYRTLLFIQQCEHSHPAPDGACS